MARENEPPTRNERGDEVHPAFGMIRASRVTGGNKSLFDSDIQHNHYVILEISTASRKRDLNTDWIHPGRHVIEVAMSEAQWASFVSSMNTSGVPCTLEFIAGDGDLPGLPFDSRLQLSHDETRAAAQRAFEHIKEAFAAVEEKPTKANIRSLRSAIENAPANVEFAAKSLTEHAENVVQKARADIEAMVTQKAAQIGLDPGQVLPSPELEAGS